MAFLIFILGVFVLGLVTFVFWMIYYSLCYLINNPYLISAYSIINIVLILFSSINSKFRTLYLIYFVPFLFFFHLFLGINRINNDNPNFVQGANISSESWFPTPSRVVLDYDNKLRYYCSNHAYEINFPVDESFNSYDYKDTEQPCKVCLPYETRNGGIIDFYKSFDVWHFKPHKIKNGWTAQIEYSNGAPINWKNIYSNIKNYDTLISPIFHGFSFNKRENKLIFIICSCVSNHNCYWLHHPYFSNSTYNKSYEYNENNINYLNGWYYKVPKFDLNSISKPTDKFFGIKYILID